MHRTLRRLACKMGEESTEVVPTSLAGVSGNGVPFTSGAVDRGGSRKDGALSRGCRCGVFPGMWTDPRAGKDSNCSGRREGRSTEEQSWTVCFCINGLYSPSIHLTLGRQ